jgi:hypothetical protein
LTHKLVAAEVICTELACEVLTKPDGTPVGAPSCCNHCEHGGSWSVLGSPQLVVTWPAGKAPRCKVDGCGKCPYELDARGRRSAKGFDVVSWKKLP